MSSKMQRIVDGRSKNGFVLQICDAVCDCNDFVRFDGLPDLHIIGMSNFPVLCVPNDMGQV